MNKKVTFVLIFFLVANCSFNSNSKFWTKKKIIEVETDSKITEIFKKDKIFKKKLTPNLKLSSQKISLKIVFLII